MICKGKSMTGKGFREQAQMLKEFMPQYQDRHMMF